MAGLSFNNGYANWYTLEGDDSKYRDGDEMGGVSAYMIMHSAKLESYFDSVDWNKTASNLRKFSGYAFTFSQLVEAGDKHASIYGAPKPYSTMSLYFEKKILGKKVLSLKLPFRQVNADKALKWAGRAKVAGTALGVAGVGLGIYDISQNGFTTSNTLDTAMSALAVTPTGVTQGIAGTYFILNAASSIITGKDIGQHLDENGYNLGEFINNIGK
ncbi:hypothetical protein [Chryseobacterium sp. YIM B08800]|uniref:hypothetical protein n=1 Tax=Chryseobacterium sp. YIM B08800 TaxID=2984136 RepID=UPI002240B4CC|nr:hypothetical protein [Chryseobacterium sp. YIM B08800]